MGKYIVKRIVLAAVTIWAVATITFFLMNLVPGGPFLSEKAISPAATAALEDVYKRQAPFLKFKIYKYSTIYLLVWVIKNKRS